MPKNRNKIRNDVIKDIRLLLGDGMIDIELDPEHYDVALDVAISKVRQRSENAVEEDFYAMDLKEDVAEYSLPEEIIEVKQNISSLFKSHSNLKYYSSINFLVL